MIEEENARIDSLYTMMKSDKPLISQFVQIDVTARGAIHKHWVELVY